MAKKVTKPNTKFINNQYVIRPGKSIGFLDAESDRELLDIAFYEKEDMKVLSDVANPKCILIGRTGSGKTAFLNSIENTQHLKVFRIEPEHMSLRYLSNSDIIQYFEKLNIKLDLIYKTLWKHVFIVEFFKMYCGTDTQKRENILDRIFESDKVNARKIARTYLDKWKDSFWENSEIKIKEIESNIKNSLSAKFGFNPEISTVKLGELASQHEKERNETVRKEIYNKSQSVIQELQIHDLTSVIDSMKSGIFESKKGKYVIIIDDLDKEWVDKKLVYDLIRTMIEALNELNRVDGIKIIVAIRENLLNLVINSSNRGNQREKFDSQIQRISWSREELYSFVNKRIKIVFKEKYTNQSPNFEDIFKYNSNGSNLSFDYFLERTLMRPRDLISFVNICIRNASGRPEVNGETIRNSEREYSLGRIRAIQDEWVENYPIIRDIVNLLHGFPETFLASLIAEKLPQFILSRFSDEKTLSTIGDKRLENLITAYQTSMTLDEDLVKMVLIIFYNVGLVGIKPSSEDKVEFSYENSYWALEENHIQLDTKVTIHKMFRRGLNCVPMKR